MDRRKQLSVRGRARCRATSPTATALVALAGLALAGCGGGSASTTPTGPTGASGATGIQGATSSTLDVSETEYTIALSKQSVAPGQVTFKVSNDGGVTHNFEIEAPSGDQELTADLSPGDRGQLTVDLPQPGTYTYYCPLSNHRELGMAGKITVR